MMNREQSSGNCSLGSRSATPLFPSELDSFIEKRKEREKENNARERETQSRG